MATKRRFRAGISIADGDPPTAYGEARHEGVELRVNWMLRNGRLEPVHFQIFAPDQRALTATQIRRLPIGEMLEAMLREIDDLARRALVDYERRGDPGDGAVVARFVRRGPQRGQALTEADLTAVANAYLAARLEGKPVTAAVQKACHLSRSGASKRIMAARRAGLLDDIESRR